MHKVYGPLARIFGAPLFVGEKWGWSGGEKWGAAIARKILIACRDKGKNIETQLRAMNIIRLEGVIDLKQESVRF